MQKLIPLLDVIQFYKKANLRGDVSAGLTVGVMLIPQGMAYAMIAGLPPIYGLYASTIPLIIYAFLGTSRHLAVGPVAMVSLLTASGIGTLASGESELYISFAIVLAFLVGLFQFLLGVFRMGFLVNFLSHPVISGFTSAAALVIGLSQLKHLLGIDINRSHHIHEIVQQAAVRSGDINWVTVAIGLVGIIIIVGVKRYKLPIPGQLLVVAASILAVWGFGLTDYNVKIIGAIPDGLPSFQIPTLGFDLIQSLLPIALAISLVSFMESIAVAKAVQAKHKNYKIDANQELIALGSANIAGSFFQSYPVTGGFSRTAVNDQAGATSGVASIISALVIILTLMFMTPLFYNLPNAVLASIIMVAVAGLIDIKEVKHLWHTNKSDFWMLVITFFATLSLGIEQGIGIGVLLSLAMIIYKSSRPHIADLGRIPESNIYRNVHRFKNLEQRDDLLILRFDAQLHFANIAYFKDALELRVLKKEKSLKAIIIDMKSVTDLDSTGAHGLSEVIRDMQGRGIDFYLSGVRGPVRDKMSKSNLIDIIQPENLFMSVHDTIEYINNPDGCRERSHQKYVLQSNTFLVEY